jgi:hypothetical protein
MLSLETCRWSQTDLRERILSLAVDNIRFWGMGNGRGAKADGIFLGGEYLSLSIFEGQRKDVVKG